jgi:hypothetical protein
MVTPFFSRCFPATSRNLPTPHVADLPHTRAILTPFHDAPPPTDMKKPRSCPCGCVFYLTRGICRFCSTPARALLNSPAESFHGVEPMALMMNSFVTPKKIKIAILVLMTFAAMC